MQDSTLGSRVSIKPRQNFDFRDKHPCQFTILKNTIYRDRIQEPSSNYRILAYVKPCNAPKLHLYIVGIRPSPQDDGHLQNPAV